MQQWNGLKQEFSTVPDSGSAPEPGKFVNVCQCFCCCCCCFLHHPFSVIYEWLIRNMANKQQKSDSVKLSAVEWKTNCFIFDNKCRHLLQFLATS